MRLELEPSGTVITLEGTVNARVWNGFTSGGIKVKALVYLIAVDPGDQAAFAREVAGAGGITELVDVRPSDDLAAVIEGLR